MQKITFKQFLKEYALYGDYAGASHDTTVGIAPYESPNIWTGDSNNGMVPQHNIGLPQVNRRGKVVRIEYKTGGNAEIHLDDRTVLRLTQGDISRIGGDPLLPPDPITHQPRSTLTVVFQRSPGNTSAIVSQITKATCENLPKVRVQPVNGISDPLVANSASETG